MSNLEDDERQPIFVFPYAGIYQLHGRYHLINDDWELQWMEVIKGRGPDDPDAKLINLWIKEEP